MKLRPLKLNYFTPAYLNFSVPPLETKEKPWLMPLTKLMAEIQVKFYSLGSITIRYELIIEGENYKEILEKAKNILRNSQHFEKKTKETIKKYRKLVERQLGIKTYSGFIEDYDILWIQDRYNFSKKPEIKSIVSQFLRNENVQLSKYEQNEAFRYNFSYTPYDLTVVDWDRTVTIGENSEDDVWDVLEYANLQLLELRYYEFKLDKRLNEIYEFSKTERFQLLKFYKTHNLLRKTLKIFTDFTSVEERINRFLRLTGDEYLSRIYAAASARLNIKSTEEHLKEHLNDAKELYEMLSSEASSIRAEILEIIIILLITFEIILPIFQ